MSSAFRSFLAGLLLIASPALAAELRVCADPNNLPFSNDKGEGFENKIVEIIADELGREVFYTWWAMRRGFVRNTLDAGLCDLVPGAPAGMERLSTTQPYYRSGYVFVTRTADHLALASLDDPRLHDLTIGVQLIGDDGANSPPVHALARRGVVGNLRGYTVYGNYANPNPAGRIVGAVAAGEVDIAIVWGPFAGYFAPRASEPLEIAPVEPEAEAVFPMRFDIAMGVRRSDDELLHQVEAALVKRRAKINEILASFGVPRFDVPATALR